MFICVVSGCVESAFDESKTVHVDIMSMVNVPCVLY